MNKANVVAKVYGACASMTMACKGHLDACRVSTRPMKVTDNLTGFTLIELLMVVLIIGILVAVALPQYQLAVAKSRVATILPIIKSIGTAEEVYYLANGDYALNFSDLDVNLPADCTRVEDNTTSMKLKCGADFIFDIPSDKVGIFVNYCPGNNTNFSTCSNTRSFQIQKFFEHIEETARASSQGKWICQPIPGSAFGQKVCSSLSF